MCKDCACVYVRKEIRNSTSDGLLTVPFRVKLQLFCKDFEFCEGERERGREGEREILS
jgi:hypothetical protein